MYISIRFGPKHVDFVDVLLYFRHAKKYRQLDLQMNNKCHRSKTTPTFVTWVMMVNHVTGLGLEDLQTPIRPRAE